jgi:hypothetical protein
MNFSGSALTVAGEVPDIASKKRIVHLAHSLGGATEPVDRLFPTFVWQSRLAPEFYEPLNRNIMAYTETLMRAGSGTRTGAAWQSGHAL